MAKCDKGYLCLVCGKNVDRMKESDLYLRYILGEVTPDRLHLEKELHIRCNPERAQYIDHPDFQDVILEGPFSKTNLDPSFVRQEQARVSAAYQRLQQLTSLGISILDYPGASQSESS
ncbi:MAG: hypothetical protein RL595_3406 [Planctomycetota bacterium]|jgi:hypothetical protein